MQASLSYQYHLTIESPNTSGVFDEISSSIRVFGIISSKIKTISNSYVLESGNQHLSHKYTRNERSNCGLHGINSTRLNLV